jgi:DNA-binding transcriptional regulator YbjK
MATTPPPPQTPPRLPADPADPATPGTPVDPATPARPRGAVRRELLLEATLALLGEIGADAVTHRRVAARAGLPLASTTYWFASKDELLTEALRHAASEDVARLRAAAAAAATSPTGATTATEPPTPRAIVDVLLKSESELSRGSLMATYTLMLEAARRPALQQLSRDWTDAYLEVVGALLHRAGSHRPADDARLLIAAADGLSIDELAGGTHARTDPRPELERLTRALLQTPR